MFQGSLVERINAFEMDGSAVESSQDNVVVGHLVCFTCLINIVLTENLRLRFSPSQRNHKICICVSKARWWARFQTTQHQKVTKLQPNKPDGSRACHPSL